MPLRRLDAEYCTLEPEELSFLQGIFDEICAAAGPMRLAEREAIARKLLTLFKGGTTDRQLLRFGVLTATRFAVLTATRI